MYLIAFLGGLLTVLSPCILPVVPFLFAGANRTRSSILLTLAGMALTFALISILAVVSSEWVIQASNDQQIQLIPLGVMDVPADYGRPCPSTPQEMNRRFIHQQRLRLDPDKYILRHIRRIATVSGSSPVAAGASPGARWARFTGRSSSGMPMP